MKTILERHAYAPEPNKIIVKRSSGWHWIKAPGVQSVKQWREQNRPRVGIFCTLSGVFVKFHDDGQSVVMATYFC